MSKLKGVGHRVGADRNRSQVQNPKTGLWTKRDTRNGQFTNVKTTGGKFKSTRQEK